jgi:hypothetical protein
MPVLSNDGGEGGGEVTAAFFLRSTFATLTIDHKLTTRITKGNLNV